MTMTRRKVHDAEDARSCLEAASRSGLDRAAWARAQGIDARSLNAWRLNLARRTGARSPLRLVELVVPPVATNYRVRCGVFEVEVSDDFDEGVLARLLSVVAGC